MSAILHGLRAQCYCYNYKAITPQLVLSRSSEYIRESESVSNKRPAIAHCCSSFRDTHDVGLCWSINRVQSADNLRVRPRPTVVSVADTADTEAWNVLTQADTPTRLRANLVAVDMLVNVTYNTDTSTAIY